MSVWFLDFSDRVDYSRHDAITVDLFLSAGSQHISVEAKVDTGSKFCIFQPHYAHLLGINLQSGSPERIRTAAGSFPAYGHEVTLTVTYFAEPESFPVNVVGRAGFLDHLRVGLVDYEHVLYLGAYGVE